ncbi:MAG: hypothetical protein ABSG04_15420 [Verrucomicrobiota bacterium]
MPTMVHKSSAPAGANGPVDARRATESAFAYFHTLFSETLSGSDPSLEEIEMSKDGRFWLVTIGFNAPRPQELRLRLPEFLQVPMRKLKVFKVDAASGRVLSMKIPHDA